MSLIKLKSNRNEIESPFFILGDGDIGISKVKVKRTDGITKGGIKFVLLNKKYKLREYVDCDAEI